MALTQEFESENGAAISDAPKSRRDFLKLFGALAGGAALASLPIKEVFAGEQVASLPKIRVPHLRITDLQVSDARLKIGLNTKKWLLWFTTAMILIISKQLKKP